MFHLSNVERNSFGSFPLMSSNCFDCLAPFSISSSWRWSKLKGGEEKDAESDCLKTLFDALWTILEDDEKQILEDFLLFTPKIPWTSNLIKI